MNDKLILLTFVSIWSIFFLFSSNFLNQNYQRVNKIIIKPIDKLPDNLYLKNILLKKFEAKLDHNKTCQIDVLNVKMIENIIYNIDKNNYKYFTVVKKNNLCEKPETFNIIVLEKISINIFLIFISLLFTILLINIILEYGDFKFTEYNIFKLNKSNYKKNDEINNYNINDSYTLIEPNTHIIESNTDIMNNKIDTCNNLDNMIIFDDELTEYDIIENSEIKKINWLEYV